MSEIKVRLGKSNPVKDGLRTPIYLEGEKESYSGIVIDDCWGDAKIRWNQRTPDYIRAKQDEFLRIYFSDHNAIPA